MNLVHFLTEHGADIKAKDNKGQTLLHYAAMHGNLFEFAIFENHKEVQFATNFVLESSQSKAVPFTAVKYYDTIIILY